MSKVKDLTGLRLGRLVVISREGNTKEGRATWLCMCDCGKTTIKQGKLLLNGHCKSCGCGEYENRVNNITSHRLSNTRLYGIWKGMKQRCNDPNHISFNSYGARGIKVCDEWSNDFKSFYDWAISNGYEDYLTIDRIDNDKGYSPQNCRWATAKEQRLNQRPRKKVG